MSLLDFLFGSRPSPARQPSRPALEALEDRVVPAAADLDVYRPVTQHFAATLVAEAQEDSYTVGAGVRINSDDDNANNVQDRLESVTASGGDNDLLQLVVGTNAAAMTLAYTDNLKVWTSATKTVAVASGATVAAGPYWVEFVGAAHTTDSTPATLTLTPSDGAAADGVVLHTFRSVVVAIGGNGQNPANVGDPALGVFTIATTLYQQGYDVRMFSHDQVASNGTGAAYTEVVSAVTQRDVDYVAIYGYSWGGGATYELANGLKNNAALTGQFTLSYTAYIDAITHGWISAERRLPPGTQYNDNVFQRRDWLLKGNTVSGSNTNLNVTTTSWGSTLNHTGVDDHANVRAMIVTNLTGRVIR